MDIENQLPNMPTAFTIYVAFVSFLNCFLSVGLGISPWFLSYTNFPVCQAVGITNPSSILISPNARLTAYLLLIIRTYYNSSSNFFRESTLRLRKIIIITVLPFYYLYSMNNHEHSKIDATMNITKYASAILSYSLHLHEN